MSATASDLFLERLIEWGVDTVFGLPGDGINGFMEALRRHRDQMRAGVRVDDKPVAAGRTVMIWSPERHLQSVQHQVVLIVVSAFQPTMRREQTPTTNAT